LTSLKRKTREKYPDQKEIPLHSNGGSILFSTCNTLYGLSILCFFKEKKKKERKRKKKGYLAFFFNIYFHTRSSCFMQWLVIPNHFFASFVTSSSSSLHRYSAAYDKETGVFVFA
jgi:hypothetical protein